MLVFNTRMKDGIYRSESGCVILDVYTEPKAGGLTVFIQDGPGSDKYRVRRLEILDIFREREDGVDAMIGVADIPINRNSDALSEEEAVTKILMMKEKGKKIGAAGMRRIVGTLGIAYVSDDVPDDDVLENIGLAYKGLHDCYQSVRN